MSLHFLLSWILTLIITDLSVSEKIVKKVGDDATLPCSYLVQNPNDLTSVCWGRGRCHLNGCGDTIVKTDGKKVIFQSNSRYNLKGNLLKGNVSLTITGVTKADSGMYCCRVEIAGWFNDEKNNRELEIWQVTFTRNYTSSSHQNQTSTKMTKEPQDMNTRATAVYIGISTLVGLSLFTLLAVIIFKRNLKNGGKLQNLSAISKFSPQRPGTQLAMEERPHTEENVYSIEENAYEIEDG
ncbi:hepatitis A virus cellular receptor 2 homolog isoform X2 [Tachyglossus aculeatus]|uniref:hepatitis A virus cellular receptor 2 homolog isoform X2 n=1 Tax=Tachyglossus aculeatus TaxID=9261 RepID=UPI0018F73917|nr:hepatitis A virus cellular receptor 2 homolog isoform X2 [Tachyglossus aculeatus]